MSIACGTDPPIHRLHPGLHQRHGAVSWKPVWVVLHIYLRLKTVECIQSLFKFYHMSMYRAVSLRWLMYRRTPDVSRTFVTRVVRNAVFRARGPGSIPYRCSLPLTSEFASRSGSPYPSLNTHLGGFACGPRLGCGGSRKKGRRDLVTRSLLSNVWFSSFSKLGRRDLTWR